MLFGSTFLPVARREWIGYLITGVWGRRILGILAMTLLSRENRQKIASLYEFCASRCGGDTRRTDYYDPRSVPLSFSFVQSKSPYCMVSYCINPKTHWISGGTITVQGGRLRIMHNA